ncbi:hypothetical protein ACI3PL_27515, partial [Lacticaseibacillus paracasei]
NWMVNKLDWTGAGSKVAKEVHSQAEEARKSLGIGRVNATGGLAAYAQKQQEAMAKAEEERQKTLKRIQGEAARTSGPRSTKTS